MQKEEISLIVQLVKTLEDAEVEMENVYSSGDYDKFVRIKKLISGINKKIGEMLE